MLDFSYAFRHKKDFYKENKEIIIKSHKAIFFDRDDTLLHDSHYMYRPEQLEFIEDVFDILKQLQNKDYLLFIVTNQSGIGRGYFSEEQMHEFHGHMLKQLDQKGIKIQEIAFCPHSPDDKCNCRKPSPKLINELCNKYDIDKSQSYMVGDRDSDIEAGKNAGVHTFKVSSENSLQNLLDLL